MVPNAMARAGTAADEKQIRGGLSFHHVHERPTRVFPLIACFLFTYGLTPHSPVFHTFWGSSPGRGLRHLPTPPYTGWRGVGKNGAGGAGRRGLGVGMARLDETFAFFLRRCRRHRLCHLY
eukprot:gene18200-biopygen18949